MQLRLLVVLMLWLPTTSLAAEIYTFGKHSDGTRFVKNVDRPQKSREEVAESAAKPGQPPPPVTSPRAAPRPMQPIPPPIPDRQKLDLLDKPI